MNNIKYVILCAIIGLSIFFIQYLFSSDIKCSSIPMPPPLDRGLPWASISKDPIGGISYYIGGRSWRKNDLLEYLPILKKAGHDTRLWISPDVEFGAALSFLNECSRNGLNPFYIETCYGIDGVSKKPLYIGCDIDKISETILSDDNKRLKLERPLYRVEKGLTYEIKPIPFTGVARLYHPNGIIREENNYKEGILEGKSVRFYENGNKEYEFNYKNGEYDGLCIQWYDNGNKEAEDNYKNGVRHGLCTTWYENGNKKTERTIIDGKSVSDIGWNEDGSPR